MSGFYWNKPQFMAQQRVEYDRRLGIAAEGMATYMRNLLAEDYPPASQPGESPHRRTGNLQAGVHVEKPGELKRRVGSDAYYAVFLELKQRPFLLKTLMATRDQTVEAVVGTSGTLGVAAPQPFAGSFAPGFAPTPNAGFGVQPELFGGQT